MCSCCISGSGNIIVSGGSSPIISLQGAIPVINGGTGLTTVGIDGQVLTALGGALAFTNVGTGTVTSVAASVPSVLSITGSPITTTGTLTIGYSGTALPILNGGTGLTVAGVAPGNSNDQFLAVIAGFPNTLAYRNLKDLYLLNMFLPEISSTQVFNTLSYTVQEGRWRQVGTLVTCFFQLTGNFVLATPGSIAVETSPILNFPPVFDTVGTVVFNSLSSLNAGVQYVFSGHNEQTTPFKITLNRPVPFSSSLFPDNPLTWTPYIFPELENIPFTLIGTISFIIA
jgi:hypothetical protein